MESTDGSGPKRLFAKTITMLSSKLNPAKAYRHTKEIIKKHGVTIGVVAITFELVEHLILPGVLVYTFGPEYVVVAGMPIGEIIFYPLLFKYLA